MLKFIEKVESELQINRTVSLPWEKRIKSRLRVRLENGEEAGIILDRGMILRGGDVLASADGELLKVEAAPETVSIVRPGDPLQLARLCYHLGNRHVSLEIAAAELAYLHDHVLDQLVVSLGGEVMVENRPFEPEHGAYSGPSGDVEHSHSHEHGRHHGHEQV